MYCLVCNCEMNYYFTKTFNKYGLRDVEYWKCTHCGFVSSKTHSDMPHELWSNLNISYHQTYQDKEHNADDPRWLARLHAQAEVLDDASSLGLLKAGGRWVDYASGGGQLASILDTNYGRTLLNYDKYMPSQAGFLGHHDLVPRTFDFVITTSVFEHFTQRADYDSVESLVAPAGVLGLHTLICENIPKDPEWFYLLPVHCAFFTNKSISIMFEQWRYQSSVYNIDARLWLWFKEESASIREVVEKANKRSGQPKYIYKNGFVDYWK